jgi:hypothetical protein
VSVLVSAAFVRAIAFRRLILLLPKEKQLFALFVGATGVWCCTHKCARGAEALIRSSPQIMTESDQRFER